MSIYSYIRGVIMRKNIKIKSEDVNVEELYNLVSVYHYHGQEPPIINRTYDFFIPINAGYLEIGGRTAVGTKVYFELINLADYHSDMIVPLVGYGDIGASYPEQVTQVINGLSNNFYVSWDNIKNRFHFIHISDNHNDSFGKAEQFLDLSPAQFLINTGDLVNDKLADGAENTISFLNTPTKPVYLALGNHDYCVYNDLTKQDIFDTFITPMNTHNGTTFDKTYYAVDFSEYLLKMIVLDQNDGWTDEELINQNPTTLTYSSKMSSAQINWFINELNDAIVNGYAVMLFIHYVPDTLNVKDCIPKFIDQNPIKAASFNYSFVCDIIDDFMAGTSGSVTPEGNTYSYSFGSPGIFVSWFVGHTHSDQVGYLLNHPKQFAIHVPQPYTSAYSKDGTSYTDKRLGVHFNYVTIDRDDRKLSVFRIGDNKSKWGGEKIGFEVFF